MTTTTTARHGDAGLWRWLRRRTELGFALGVLAIAVFLTVGTLTMEVPDGAGSPGPRFFPTLVAGFLYVTGALLAVDVIRHPKNLGGTGSGQFSTDMLRDLGAMGDGREIADLAGDRISGEGSAVSRQAGAEEDATEHAGALEPPGSEYVPVDYRTLGLVLAGLVLFIVMVVPVGWLISSAILFWIVCHALGSRRPVFDIAVSIITASIVQLAFSAALGLNLPAGILEGVVPWSS